MNDTIGHGDELAYLFELNDIYGNSLEAKDLTLSEDDQKVRDIFTQMIADFAKTGKIHLEDKEVQPFSSKKNNFIQIKPIPVLGTDFKFCEVAIWCNLADRLKNTACSFLKALDTQVQNVKKVIDDVVSPIGGELGINNLLGGGGSSNKQKLDNSKNKNAMEMLSGGLRRPTSNTNQKQILPGFGGLNSFIG